MLLFPLTLLLFTALDLRQTPAPKKEINYHVLFSLQLNDRNKLLRNKNTGCIKTLQALLLLLILIALKPGMKIMTSEASDYH